MYGICRNGVILNCEIFCKNAWLKVPYVLQILYLIEHRYSKM